MMLEAGHPRWRVDLTEADTPAEAGLDGAAPLKEAEFIGRSALLRARGTETRRRLACLVIEGDGPDSWGEEPVFDGATAVALLRSAGYGHRVGKALGWAYLPAALAAPGTRLEVDVLGVRHPATVARAPVYTAGAGAVLEAAS